MFKNREEAGQLLAKKLEKTIRDQDWIVVALLRGGIVLGKKISDHFKIPLFPLAVKKIGAPTNPELGIGAVTFDKTVYFDTNLINELAVPVDYQESVKGSKYQEARNLQEKIEKNTPAGGKNISWAGENVIIVDDGVATGNTVICASLYLKKQKIEKIILATPVISKDSLNNVGKYVDRIVALKIAKNLGAVGEFYKYFPQVEDKEVMELI